MMRRDGWLALGCVLLLTGCAGQRTLDIYFIDMVGGAATLVVTPERESILFDTGAPLERDAERILSVVRDEAGLDRIDHVVITHWHLDHYGALGLMDGKIAFGEFYDRGIPDEMPEDPKNFPTLIEAYREVSRGTSTTIRAGWRKQFGEGDAAVRLYCPMASNEVDPAPSGREVPNPWCDLHAPKPADTSDNGKSIVLLLSYGAFDFLMPADLTWNYEAELVCPENRVGHVELLQVSHHGLDASSNPACVYAVQPEVAVMLNGPRKGGAASVLKTLWRSPGLVDLWQLHRNARLDADEQCAADRIANPDNPKGGAFIKATVSDMGRHFTVQIGADGEAEHYASWAE